MEARIPQRSSEVIRIGRSEVIIKEAGPIIVLAQYAGTESGQARSSSATRAPQPLRSRLNSQSGRCQHPAKSSSSMSALISCVTKTEIQPRIAAGSILLVLQGLCMAVCKEDINSRLHALRKPSPAWYPRHSFRSHQRKPPACSEQLAGRYWTTGRFGSFRRNPCQSRR